MQLLSSFNTNYAALPRFLRRNHQPVIPSSSSINPTVENLAPSDRKALLSDIWQLMENRGDIHEWHLSTVDTILSMELDAGVPRRDIKPFNHTIEVVERWIGRKGWDVETAPANGKTGLEVQALRLRNRLYILRGQLARGGRQWVA